MKKERKISSTVWLLLLVSIFVVKNVLLASIGTPWYAEDEPSHFGYIEALAREGKWYVFSQNFSSVDNRLAHRWWDMAEDKDRVIKELARGEFRQYRSVASTHKNATAYQAPLFYWAMSKIYKSFPGVDIVSMLYLMRMVNVLIGAIYIAVVYLICKKFFGEGRRSLVAVSLIVFLPLLSLTSASVTVQVDVFLMYALFIIAILKAFDRPMVGYLMAMLITVAGLLTQQAFWAAPVLMLLMLGIDVMKKRITFKQLLVLVTILGVGVSLILPQLVRRHRETRYTISEGERSFRRLSPFQYLPAEWDRLQEEVVASFWDQNRSFMPYYSSSRAKRVMRVLLAVSLVGLMARLNDKMRKRVKGWETRALVFFLMMIGVFVGGHLWFDYRQLIYSGQEYIKARYFYPVLPILIVGFVYGLSKLSKRESLQRALLLFAVISMIFTNYSAMWWLFLKIGSL